MGLDSYVFACGHEIDDPDWIEYKTKYSHMGRSELSKNQRALYLRLNEKKLLKHIPRKHSRSEEHWKTLASGVYDGLSRGKIEVMDFAHYLWLRKNGLLVNYPSNRWG